MGKLGIIHSEDISTIVYKRDTQLFTLFEFCKRDIEICVTNQVQNTLVNKVQSVFKIGYCSNGHG